MGDISDMLPKDSPVVSAIYEHYKKVGDSEEQRGYLGASIIGAECPRFLWYCFRQACTYDFSGRLYRLFETGDLEEARFVKNLRDIGCEVYDFDPRTGEQFELMAFNGHLSGHCDSVLRGVPGAEKSWHIGEYKTHNAKSFAKLEKEGVMASKPQHYAQMQIYMHLSKPSLGKAIRRALYLARNKDNDALYAERVHYDAAYCEAMMMKARHIITSPEPPEKISKRSDFYKCKWCDAHAICWGSADGIALPVMSLSCRQCCHATPIIDGDDMDARWVCEKGQGLAQLDQDNPCDEFLVLPGMISFAEPVGHSGESGGEYIEFQNGIGTTNPGARWVHSPHAHLGHSGKTLMSMPVDVINEPILDAAKNLFGARALGTLNPILHRYPEDKCDIVFKGVESEGVKDISDAMESAGLEYSEPVGTYDCDEYRACEYPGKYVIIEWKPTVQVRPLIGSKPEGCETITEIRNMRT